MKNPLAETIITRTHLLIATQNYLYFFNPTTIAAAKYNAKHTLLTFGSSCIPFQSILQTQLVHIIYHFVYIIYYLVHLNILQGTSIVSAPRPAISRLTETAFAVHKYSSDSSRTPFSQCKSHSLAANHGREPTGQRPWAERTTDVVRPNNGREPVE